MPAPLIRPAVAADRDRLLEIQRASPGAAQWVESDYDRLLSGEGAPRCLAAESGGKVAGFLVYQRLAPEEAELLNIAVEPCQRLKGVGRALLASLLDQVGGEVFLEVRSSNTSAQGFYERSGFCEAGRRPSYYQNPLEDAILMRWTSSRR